MAALRTGYFPGQGLVRTTRVTMRRTVKGAKQACPAPITNRFPVLRDKAGLKAFTRTCHALIVFPGSMGFSSIATRWPACNSVQHV